MIEQPPQQAALFVRLIGVEMTLRLMELHGGLVVFVPRTASPGQRLACELSPEAEAALVEEFGGGNIEVPICRSWRARIYRERGMTHREVAQKLGCTQRIVRRYLSQDVASTQAELAF